MDQCKYTAESRTFQRLPPFGRGEIKALSGEGLGVPAIRENRRGQGRRQPRDRARDEEATRHSDSAERFEYFAETGEAAFEKNRKNSRNTLKIGECPDFIEYAGEKLGKGGRPMR
ncbi:MAG: hypothetical protein LBU32_13810 [Clostridiales bacterium]|jgi:hypothetical protein|nr:hypothetical protein [Clostridiales bacterium]